MVHLAAVQSETRTADQILLLYTDSDADKILIASDDDLKDAMEQYAAAGTLKVFATLRYPKEPQVDLLLGGVPCQGYSGDHVHMSPPCQGYSAAKRGGGQAAYHVHASPPCQGYPAANRNGGADEVIAEQFSKDVAAEAAADAAAHCATMGVSKTVHHVHMSPPCQGYSTANRNGGQNEANEVAEQFSKAVAAATAEAAAAAKVACASMAAAAAARNSTTPPVQTPARPFIHGRHTCDSCLTTPIVGERYHAVNLPDYDLCKACNGNYKGDAIRFEVAQLGTFLVVLEKVELKRERF